MNGVYNIQGHIRKALPEEIPKEEEGISIIPITTKKQEEVLNQVRELLAKPIDLRKSKIWIGNDEELSKKVFDRLIELGCKASSWALYNDNIHKFPFSFYISDSLQISWSSSDCQHNKFMYNNHYSEIPV